MDEQRVNNDMLTMALLLVIVFFAVGSCLGQETRDTGRECSPAEAYYCQLWPNIPCPCASTPEQVRPFGPPYDPWLGDYRLPQVIAVTQVHHEIIPSKPPALQQFDNLTLARDVYSAGFGGLKVWIQEHPFNCGGEWTWRTYYGQEMTTPGYDYCLGEDMMRFWHEQPLDLLIVRPIWDAWAGTDENGYINVAVDYYDVARRLYREIGYRNMVIILTDWEQDHLYKVYPQHTIQMIEQRQAGVERARREAFLELEYRPNLRVMHAVILNTFPNNGGEEGKMLAERISGLSVRPDLLGISYWMTSKDPAETLDWVREKTGYPARRIYIDEVGADEQNQVQRFEDYIPAFRAWGIKGPIAVWLWKQTWCDPEHQRGLWKQAQPCQGKPVFTEPTDGMILLEELQ